MNGVLPEPVAPALARKQVVQVAHAVGSFLPNQLCGTECSQLYGSTDSRMSSACSSAAAPLRAIRLSSSPRCRATSMSRSMNSAGRTAHRYTGTSVTGRVAGRPTGTAAPPVNRAAVHGGSGSPAPSGQSGESAQRLGSTRQPRPRPPVVEVHPLGCPTQLRQRRPRAASGSNRSAMVMVTVVPSRASPSRHSSAHARTADPTASPNPAEAWLPGALQGHGCPRIGLVPSSRPSGSASR